MSNPRRTEAALLVLALVLTFAANLLAQLANSEAIPAGTGTVALWMAALFLVAHLAIRRLAPKASPILLPVAGVLLGLGYAMIRRLDGTQQGTDGIAAAQGVWILLGVVSFVVTLVLLRDYRVLDRYRYIAGLVGLVLLFLPLLPVIGVEVNGARLWVRVAGLQFQPGEMAKIFLVVFFASFLRERRELLVVNTGRLGPFRIPDPKHLGPLLAVWGLSLLVMLVQKDLGSSLLLFATFLFMLYMATGRLSFVLTGVVLFVLGVLMATQLLPGVFGHVDARIAGWLDPFDPATVERETFQLAQSLLALASGGVFGAGLGLGSPWRIPFAHTDFIFSALGEELGLLGAAAIVLLFLLVVGAGLRVALRCTDTFGKLLAGGLTVALGVQTFVIVGGVTSLIPLTGITLPFMSYGGSSILANFVLLAMLVAISDQQVSGPRGSGLVFRRKALAVGERIPEPVGGDA